MLILAFILFIAGFCALYAASPRSAFRGKAIALSAQAHPARFRLLGWSLSSLAFASMMRHYGFGAGLFFGALLVTAFYGLAILLLPLLITEKRMESR